MKCAKICDENIGVSQMHDNTFLCSNQMLQCIVVIFLNIVHFTTGFMLKAWHVLVHKTKRSAQCAHWALFTNHQMKLVGVRGCTNVCMHVDTTDSRINTKSTHRIQSTVRSLRELAEFAEWQMDNVISGFSYIYGALHTTQNITIVFQHKEFLPYNKGKIGE